MHIEHLLQPAEVELKRADSCPIKPHKHSFFELVYILDGEGTYVINGVSHHYRQDDVFVIIPEYGHYTVVEKLTSFVFVRFNSGFVQNACDASGINWLDRIEFIFSNQHRIHHQFSESARKFLRNLITLLLDEVSLKPDNGVLVNHLIQTLLVLLVEKIDEARFPASAPERSNIRTIIDYIHANIGKPQKLKLSTIAGQVHLSENYITEYFRKHAFRSLQRYILEYKMSRIEERLRTTDLRLTEIADEYGFSSESHLVTAFRKHKGVSPIKYRKHYCRKTD